MGHLPRPLKIAVSATFFLCFGLGIFAFGYCQGNEAAYGQAALTRGSFTVAALQYIRSGELESAKSNLETTLDGLILERDSYNENPFLVSKFLDRQKFKPPFFNMPLRTVRNYREQYPSPIEDERTKARIARALGVQE